MTGPALRALRLAKGLSLTGAAKLLGVSRSHLAGLESGAKRITYATELRAVEALCSAGKTIVGDAPKKRGRRKAARNV